MLSALGCQAAIIQSLAVQAVLALHIKSGGVKQIVRQAAHAVYSDSLYTFASAMDELCKHGPVGSGRIFVIGGH